MPFLTITDWLEKEKIAGSVNPDRAILATTTSKGVPHSRVIAIRKVESESILFFTQRGTRKVLELNANPNASMTIWLAMQQKQIILEGVVTPLSLQENELYWQTMTRERQLRFSAYAPISGRPIGSIVQLEGMLEKLEQQYQDNLIPMSEFYCGLRLIPYTICFYTLNMESFSEVTRYTKNNASWEQQLLSP